MVLRLIIFLIINFAALGIGGLFTGPGVESEWYANLQLPPWQPPGWAFGVAWTSIMLCFSVYMALVWDKVQDKQLLIACFVVQWILNVGWNPLFFHFHALISSMLTITVLTLLVAWFFFTYWRILKVKSVLILPYLLWLMVAASLNGYILINN